MTRMLPLVMMYIKPKEWDDVSYESKIYHTIELASDNEEYNKIIKPFNDSDLFVKSLERIQNPYQLGRFAVRKEQREFRNETTTKLQYYHPLHKLDLPAALEYNMDVRRYCHQYCNNNLDKKSPMFFSTPIAAVAAIPGCSEKVILVCDILGSTNEPPRTVKSTESEYMPTYVVALRN